MKKMNILKKAFATLALACLMTTTIVSNIFAKDYAGYFEMGDYYYIIDDNAPTPTFHFDANRNLDVADAERQVGKNYKDDLATWKDMVLHNYGDTLEEHYVAKAKAQELAASFNYGSDYDKFKRIYDYINETTSYDHQLSQSSHTAYSCLINHLAVCDGMSKAFQAIAIEMGLPCYLRVSNSMVHAWNAIQLDGEWYVCDVTNDSFAQDPSAWRLDYRGKEDASALNGHNAITPMNEYATLTYANHGYGVSETPAVNETANKPIVESWQETPAVVESNTNSTSNGGEASVVAEEGSSEDSNSESIGESTEENTEESSEIVEGTIVADNKDVSNNISNKESAKISSVVSEEKLGKSNISIPLVVVTTVVCTLFVITMMFFAAAMIRRYKRIKSQVLIVKKDKPEEK